MEKLDGTTRDVVQDNIEKLKQLFPEVFTEEKIDFEKLQLTLGEHIETEKERYQFTWNGKTEAIQLAQKQSTGTLRPCKEESVDWDTTQNLYIEGDNLEVLRLLQNSYRNKVKMIYIDPPYNTGKDFVYKDNFHDNVKNYKEMMDESYKSNAETNGRYHTDWLNMMYPRLKLARNTLADDGVVFISIDDSEISNLRKVCDEIFGEMNFIIHICHKARGSVSNDKIISPNHNHILLYAKNYNEIFSKRKTVGLDPDLSGFENTDEDPNGPYRLVPVDGPGGERKGNPYYEFLGISGYYRYSLETMKKKYENGEIVKRSNTLLRKYYMSDAIKSRKTDTSWWEDAGYTSSATSKLRQLMDDSVFDSPKPVDLILRMLDQFTHFDKDSIILDFFSGSSTTAHALMQKNAIDNGNRKFIMIQIPEETNPKSEGFKAGYRNICEIGKERIRRAGKKIIEENKDKEGIENLDIGFKVFKLDETNLKIWDEEADNIEDHLLFFEGAVKEGRSQEDVLYEILLKYGLDLTLPIEEEKVGEVTAFSVGLGYLVVCLDQNLSTKDIEQLVSNYPDCERMVFLDNGFATDEVKINAEQILKRNGVQDIRVI